MKVFRARGTSEGLHNPAFHTCCFAAFFHVGAAFRRARGVTISKLTRHPDHRWDPADNLKSEADIQAYLSACFEEAPDDAAYIAAALGDVARARGTTKLARRT
jgi:hypothetical protein